MTKSLVTGGAGFIGSNLVDKLIEIGHKVVVIDNESAESNERFYWNDKAQNYKYDIRDYENTRSLYDGVDYVFHLAAESRIQPAIENPIGAVSLNSVGTCTVLQCSKEAGVKRVVYSSTSSGYGMNESPNIETQPDDCLNPYSVSKVNGEKLCKMYTRLYGLPTISFRYFNVYGERQPLRGQYAPVIGIFLRQRAAGESLTIVSEFNAKHNFAKRIQRGVYLRKRLDLPAECSAAHRHVIINIAELLGADPNATVKAAQNDLQRNAAPWLRDWILSALND